MRIFFEKDGKFNVGVFLKDDENQNKISYEEYKLEMLERGFKEVK